MQFPLQRRCAGLPPLTLSAAVSLLCNTLKRSLSTSLSLPRTFMLHSSVCHSFSPFDFSVFSLLFLSIFIRPWLPLMLVPCPYYIILPATFLSASSFLPWRCFFLPTYHHVTCLKYVHPHMGNSMDAWMHLTQWGPVNHRSSAQGVVCRDGMLLRGTSG